MQVSHRVGFGLISGISWCEGFLCSAQTVGTGEADDLSPPFYHLLLLPQIINCKNSAKLN